MSKPMAQAYHARAGAFLLRTAGASAQNAPPAFPNADLPQAQYQPQASEIHEQLGAASNQSACSRTPVSCYAAWQFGIERAYVDNSRYASLRICSKINTPDLECTYHHILGKQTTLAHQNKDFDQNKPISDIQNACLHLHSNRPPTPRQTTKCTTIPLSPKEKIQGARHHGPPILDHKPRGPLNRRPWPTDASKGSMAAKASFTF